MLKIGVFDSGLGGLTVVRDMTKIIKGAEIFYIADTANAPYGEKTDEQILQYSLNITQYFIDTYQIDALIIACNTATSVAVKVLREQYPELIMIGTEPGIKPAIEITKSKHIGVLATPATLKGDKYQQLVNVLSKEKDIMLYEQACPGLVDQIEKAEINSLKTKNLLEKWLEPMRKNHVDTIVLGCTHYPLVAKMIKQIMQTPVVLIETGDAIARHLLYLAQKKGHINQGALKINLYATHDISKSMVEDIFLKKMEVEIINL